MNGIAGVPAGDGLRQLLAGAAAVAAHLLRPEELRLLQELEHLPDPSVALLARLLGRRRRLLVASRADIEPVHCAPLLAAGWLRPADPAGDRAAIAAALTLTEIGLPGPRAQAVERLLRDDIAWQRCLLDLGQVLLPSTAAEDLHRLALVSVTGDEEDPAWGVRIALGQLEAPPGSALAAWLAGAMPVVRSPFVDRAHYDAWLALRETRRQLDELGATALAETALERLAALAGAPAALTGTRYDLALRTVHLLLRCVEALPVDDERRQRALLALRRAPLDRRLLRRCAEAWWSRLRHRRHRQAIAARVAAWPCWSHGVAWRWRLRAEGRRRPRQGAWPSRRLSAWLDRAGPRVIAGGETVEAHALRQLRAEGWEGLHAEGGFWLGLALTLCWPVLAAGPWAHPARSLPADWGEWGFVARRRQHFAPLFRRLVSDAGAVLAASPLADCAARGVNLAGLGGLPPLAAMQAVCTHLPGILLARLVEALLADPGEASGLPDLLCWRAGEVQLWEVKSPGDALSDAQRGWLAWFANEGVHAGVLHVDERRQQQTLIFGSAQNLPSTVTDQRLPERRPARVRCTWTSLRLADGRILPLRTDGALPAGERWSDPATCSVDAALRALADTGHGNPWRLHGLAVTAIHCERHRGRRRLAREWLPVPAGLHWAVLRRDEGLSAGGIAPRCRAVLRRSGWLLDNGQAAQEPALIDPALLEAGTTPAEALLRRPPAVPPPAWRLRLAGTAAHGQLVDQLALLGDAPYEVRIAADGCRLAVPADAAVLWVAADVERVDLQG